MGDRTKIEWCQNEDGSPGATWNPIRAKNKETGGIGHFCTHVSEGCRNCYAERIQPRFRNPIRYAAQDRDRVDPFLDGRVLEQPLRWRKPRRVFVCSMTDLFGEFVPDEWIDRIFAVMALCPQHTFQVLTKRAERMREYILDREDREIGRALERQLLGSVPVPVLQNAHLYVSVEDQKTADERIPLLMSTPAAVRGVSLEPMLGPVSFTLRGTRISGWDEDWKYNTLTGAEWASPRDDSPPSSARLDHVIVGGESGPNARAMHPDWARSVRDQCAAAGVPFFMKQMAKRAPIPDDLMIREHPK